MTDRPLREVIAETLQGIGGLALCNEPLSSFDDSANEVADKIIAALPQTEVSETVREVSGESRERAIEAAERAIGKTHSHTHSKREIATLAVDAARQALALPVDGWRPMSEAPKDGSSIFVYWSDHDVTEIAHWVDLEEDDEGPQWYTMAADYLPANQLSHWMPLPAPPAPDRGGEDG